MSLFQQFAVKNPEEALATIPVIDYGPMFAGEKGALERVAAQLRHACEVVGFFYVKNHGVSEELVARTFDNARRFHALPLEEKLKLKLDQNNVGYLALNSSVQAASKVHKATKPNQNESFFVTHDRGPDHPDVIANTPMRGPNFWPDPALIPGFREEVMEYVHEMDALCTRMIPAFAVALGLPADYFARFFENEANIKLRMLHYPPPEVFEENQFGQAPHTDNGFMTVLAREDVPGLAVRLPNGEWFPPPLIPGTFLVNLGNLLRRWSNDRFLATPHGVLNDSGRDRYSLAYFHSPHPDSLIECLPTCQSADNPAQYPPVIYRDMALDFYKANYFHQKGHEKAREAVTMG